MTTSLPPTGRARFVQHVLPGLASGTYQLKLHQHVVLGGAKPATDDFGEVVNFAVFGDRFSLSGSTVSAVFPPARGRGDFANCLPHVVLTSRTLPWERTVTGLPAQLGSAHDDITPWLAVLVFDADEAPPVQALTIGELISPPTGYAGYSGLTLEVGELGTDRCTAIDVPSDLFARIAPTTADLPWLAHVRASGVDDHHATECAVVVGNRLPTTGHRTVAHLVSLEGRSDLLPPPTPGETPLEATPCIRLASLATWSFDCTSEPGRFSDAMRGLTTVAPLAATPVKVDDPTPEDTAVGAAMQLGYSGLTHRLRDGGRTVSWYRGPLLPSARARDTRPEAPASNADALMRYDPVTGLFDASYAAAWQLGKMLGIASPHFHAEITRWKRSVVVSCLEGLERDFLDRRIRADPGLTAGSSPSASSRALRRTDTLGSALDDPERLARVAQQAPAIPSAVTSWLNRLRRLHGVPFTYLVPTESLLARESLRFFHVDLDWVDALADGAFSLGSATAGDAAVAAAARQTQASDSATPDVVTGFLLRSEAVKGWPGLQTNAYATDPATKTEVPLGLLRYELLAVDTLLCLVDGALDLVLIHEPTEALHFGFDRGDPPDDPAHFSKSLRDLTTGLGSQLPALQPLPWRPGSTSGPGGRVVDVASLANQAKTGLTPEQAQPSSSPSGDAAPFTFTAAEFALELVEGVEAAAFQVSDP